MNTSFGLDIGSTSIKSVLIEKKKDALELKNIFLSPTPAGGMSSSSSLDEDQLANAIKTHVNDAKIKTRLVHIALPDNHVYSKVIELPMLSEKELDSAMVWEAEQYIPAPLNTIMLDRLILRTNIQSTSGPKMLVLLVGASKSLIEKYQRIIDLSGLTLSSIESETLSNSRAIVVSQSFPTSLLILFGSMSTTYVIVEGAVIVFTYTIPLGNQTLTRALATSFGFSNQQAEEYKRAYGINDKQTGANIKKVLDPILMSIVQEAKKALTFYAEKYKTATSITQIVLSGGSSKLLGLDAYFVDKLGIETVVANPFKSLNIEKVPQQFVNMGPEFAVGIGLSLKDYE